MRPGTPGAGDLEDGDTIPASQTSAPVQLDQVLGTLKTDTRQDLQKLLVGYGDAHQRQAAAGRGRRPGPVHEGRDGRQVAERLATSTPRSALRGGAIVNDALLGTDLHDLSKLIGSQQKIFAALSSREGSLKDLITNFNTTMGALASEEGEPAARRSTSCRACWRPPARRSTT